MPSTKTRKKKLIAEFINDTNSADHPSRRAAIWIIEQVLERELKKGINGKKFYDLEDEITDLIEKCKE